MYIKQAHRQTSTSMNGTDTALLYHLLQEPTSVSVDHHHYDTVYLSKKDASSLEAQLIFEFYKQQREEYMNLEKERTSVSLQFLLITGALIAAFLQNNQYSVQLAISVAIIILGLVGLYILTGADHTARMHITRARLSRDRLPFLRPIIENSDRFNRKSRLDGWRGARNDTIAWIAIYCGVIVVGMALLTQVILK